MENTAQAQIEATEAVKRSSRRLQDSYEFLERTLDEARTLRAAKKMSDDDYFALRSFTWKRMDDITALQVEMIEKTGIGLYGETAQSVR